MYNEFQNFPQNITFFIRGVYSWIFQPPWDFSNQYLWGGESKRCWTSHASFGDILQIFMHIVTTILVIPNYLPLLFLCILKILATLHIICIPSLLVSKMLNFGHKIWGRYVSGWRKTSISIQLYTPLFLLYLFYFQKPK